MLTDLAGNHIDREIAELGDDIIVAQKPVDVVVVACGRGSSGVVALGRCVVQENELVDERADWFEHEEADRRGFVEVDR